MKKVLYVLLALIAVLIIAAFAISEKYHFEKSITIKAPVDKIYPLISSTQGINQWNPWLKLDPKMKIDYSGTQGANRRPLLLGQHER